MIEDTINKIEERLRGADSLSLEKRLELEQLLGELRREAGAIEIRTPPFDDASETDARSAVNRLEESLTEFETTHPQLVGLVNRISTILSNMGI